MSGHGPTRALAEQIASFQLADMPVDAVRWTRLLVLDTLGVALRASGQGDPGSRRMLSLATREAGSHVVIGCPQGSTGSTASLVNGYLAYARDSDAVFRPAIMHVGVVTLPAAMAAAEIAESSGEAFLVAVAVGAEVASLTSQALGAETMYARGFHPTAVAGTFGAAAAAGWLLGLDADRMDRALGLAALQASGLMAWTRDVTEESRPFTAGLAPRGGFLAATLAADGFGGPSGIFDPDVAHNAYQAWSVDGIGRPDALARTLAECQAVQNLAIKRHACCAFLHTAVDGLLGLMEEHALHAGDLQRIVLRFAAAGARVIDGSPLRSHRAQYILPLAAVAGRVEFEDVMNDRTDELRMQDLQRRTEVVHDLGLDEVFPRLRACILEVHTKTGQQLSRRVSAAKGSPEDPLTDAEIEAKFRQVERSGVGEDVASRIVEGVRSLDSLADVGPLLRDVTGARTL